MGDSYRPNRAPRSRAPLADRMTFSGGGGDTYRSGDRQQNNGRKANNAEFTFSSNHNAPQFPPAGPANGGQSSRRQGRGGANRRDKRAGNAPTGNNGDRAAQYQSRPGRGRGRGGYRKPPAPHQRALLQTRDDTVEQHLGVSAGNKFRNVDDMSDDEEADMSLDSDGSNDAADDRKRKTARKQSSTVADGNSVPKWSNPEQYTALPPPAESTGKRTNVLQLIRKAKIEAAETASANNAVAANDDFIGFDNDGESADQPILLPDDAPQAAPHWNAINGQSVTGSLNDAISSTSFSLPREPRSISTRSAADAGLPPRPQHPDGFDAIPAGARSEPGRSSKRSATDAALPSRSEYSDGSSKRSRVSSRPATIQPHWMPVAGPDYAPWIYVDGQVAEHYARLANQPSSLLHNEVMDFLDYVTPRPYDIDLRNRIIERVQTAIGRTWFSSPGSVQCFGSFAAGLFLPTADMDLVYLSDKCRTTGREGLHCTKNDLYKIARKLKDKGVAIKTNVIPFAKVPIIKFEDTVTGLPVDISFEKPDGLYAQTYFKTFKTQYESEMEILVAVIKQYLLMTDLNEVSTGGLGGLSVVCLVVSYLELFPQDVSKTPNQQPNYGVSLLGFLHYYGREFDLNKTRISMTPIGHVKKGKIGIDGRVNKPDSLSIQDPNNTENNISGGSSRVRDIFDGFSNAYEALSQRMAEHEQGTNTGESILAAFIGGNYQSYTRHRMRMQKEAHKLPKATHQRFRG